METGDSLFTSDSHAWFRKKVGPFSAAKGLSLREGKKSAEFTNIHIHGFRAIRKQKTAASQSQPLARPPLTTTPQPPSVGR